MIRIIGSVLVLALGGCAAGGLAPLSHADCEGGRRPTLQWESFPTQEYRALAERIHDVTYEVRIWKACSPRRYEFRPEVPVYSKDGLKLPSHRLEQDLTAGTSYVWSVRARFQLDGNWRVSPWSTNAGWDRTADFPPEGYPVLNLR